MSTLVVTQTRFDRALFVVGAWALALRLDPAARLCNLDGDPSSAYETRFFVLLAPLTFENFTHAWNAAPFARYFLNTIMLVSMILAAQLILCIHAAFAFARLEFPGKNILFALVLVQLMVMPDILLVRNYATMAQLGLVDTILAIGLPYFASGFAIFLLRQTFKTIPKELDEAARVEGCSLIGLIWRGLCAAGQTHDSRLCPCSP